MPWGRACVFAELSQLGQRPEPGNQPGVGRDSVGAPLIAVLSADDTGAGRERLGHDGASGGQEDAASKQWGERGWASPSSLGMGGGGLPVSCSPVCWPFRSAAPLHAALQDEASRDRSARGQLCAAQVCGQWAPTARHHVDEGRPGPDRPGGRGAQEEEVDTEPEEPASRGQWQVHVPCVQPRRCHQCNLQGGRDP